MSSSGSIPDLGRRKGFLSAGAYIRGPRAVEFDLLPVAERLRIAKEQGERLHPGLFAKHVEHGVAIGWERMEFAQGGWAHEVDPIFGPNAGVLAGIQGRFKIAGDQVRCVVPSRYVAPCQ
jgi:monoamine oxidase